MESLQFEIEGDEPGGITDQEIIDQFQSGYKRNGTFALEKDGLKERILETLEVYN